MKKTCFLLIKLMTLYTSKAKSGRPIQIFECNIPHSGIRRFLVSYRQDQENNEKYAWLYDGRSHKPRVSHFKDLHKDVFHEQP